MFVCFQCAHSWTKGVLYLILLKKLIVFYSGVALLAASCTPDAPRSNPLDPYHRLAVESGEKLSGRVVRKTAPNPPLPGCDVFILPENKFTATDETGRFSFSGLQPVEHVIIAHKSGFDSARVITPAGFDASGDLLLTLNARPLFKTVAIRSEYVDQWWPDPVLSVVVEATVADPDGPADILSLRLDIAGMDSGFSFAATTRPDSFALYLQQESIPGSDLYEIVGAPVQITVMDRDSSRTVNTGEKLIRIISPAPVALSPTGLAQADPAPLMEWQPFAASYRFSYLVSVYFIRAGVPTLMFNSEPLPARNLSYRYPDSLATGTYFWTVSVVDEFGNVGRSKEASFTVP